MHQMRAVPPIGQQRQEISRENKPPIPHPMGGYNPDLPGVPTANRTQTYSPEASIAEAVQDLAQEIYARLVVGKFLDATYTAEVSAEHMQELAKSAQAAALAYFEHMGVQFHE